MEILFDGIPMGESTPSMTINSPAAILWAMYIVAAEKQGAHRKTVRGTLQNDILKEYIAQKEFLFPPRPSMRLVIDTIEFGTQAAAAVEYDLHQRLSHPRGGLRRPRRSWPSPWPTASPTSRRRSPAGWTIDEFAPRLCFFFNAHNDFFEEIAKYRAARRIWARAMREVRRQEPASLAAALPCPDRGCLPDGAAAGEQHRAGGASGPGGCAGRHPVAAYQLSWTRRWLCPAEKAVTVALRTQQIIGHESGVTNTIDPLAGSYFVEALTNRMEEEANAYFRSIDRLGGVVPAIEAGFFQREIAEAAYIYQREIDDGDARSSASTTTYRAIGRLFRSWRWIPRATTASWGV